MRQIYARVNREDQRHNVNGRCWCGKNVYHPSITRPLVQVVVGKGCIDCNSQYGEVQSMQFFCSHDSSTFPQVLIDLLRTNTSGEGFILINCIKKGEPHGRLVAADEEQIEWIYK